MIEAPYKNIVKKNPKLITLYYDRKFVEAVIRKSRSICACKKFFVIVSAIWSPCSHRSCS